MGNFIFHHQTSRMNHMLMIQHKFFPFLLLVDIFFRVLWLPKRDIVITSLKGNRVDFIWGRGVNYMSQK